MKLPSTRAFWLTYFLFISLLYSGLSLADVTATSDSQAIATTKSGSQSISGQGQSIDMGTTHVEAIDMKDRAPGVFAAGITAGGTNPCVVSAGAGISIPGGGLNFAHAYNDPECTIRETLRLMASISGPGEKSNQVLLREIACQSVIMWDAFERTYNATGDVRYFCENPRPDTNHKLTAARDLHKPEPSKWFVTPAQNDNMATPYSKSEQNKVRALLLDGREDDAFAMLMGD